MMRVGRLAVVAVATIAVVPMVAAVIGYRLFIAVPPTPPEPTDAIVVLGGEHDGREAYGLALAREGYTRTVLLSNPYLADDPTMRSACRSPNPDIRVVCFVPHPSTTLGEALFTREQARANRWRHISVISWRHHLFRAGIIFERCLGFGVRMLEMPARYDYSLGEWGFAFSYQFAGAARAAINGCPSSDTH